jgi:gamma-glutamylcyclotransferase (GGCT)/AIG2-like uncharacterized protein YtfP
MQAMSIPRLFVYGSLKPGHANAHLLERIGGTWQSATVVGTLSMVGWAAGEGYPALTLDASGERVSGFVFSSENLPAHWPALDAFEGEDYARVLATATLADGRRVDAYVYVRNRGNDRSSSD